MIPELLMAAVLVGPVGPFPDRMSAFVWRNWFCVSRDRMAETVGARPEDLDAIAAEMGLPAQPPVSADWRRKGYITVVRRNWDILDRRQIERLVDMSESEFAFRLKEEDFLSSKLGPKSDCGRLTYDRDMADRARPARLALREIVRREGIDDFTEEPRFQFVRDICRVSDRSSPLSEGDSPFDLRMIFSYFADYADPLGDDEVGSYPEGLLQKLSDDGVNAVWLHVVLSQLVRDPKYPEFGEGSERRLANLRKLVARAAKYGIRVYLYINEPRACSPEFFERGDRHSIRGLRWASSGVYTMCTSVPEVRRWLHDSMKSVFAEVKGLGGVFTITMSENLSNCASGQTKADCPRCRSRSTADILVEVNEAIIGGMREADPSAEAIAWNWQWPEDSEAEIIARLPPCRVMAVSEKGVTFTRGGVAGNVAADYSVSVVGPGPLAAKTWRLASSRGLPTVAKVQVSGSWELSTFPYIPALDLVAEHACGLAGAGVSGVMLSWSCGAAPAPNLGVFRECRRGDDPSQVLDRLAKRLYGEKAAQARAAWTAFSDGFREFPFDWPAIYYNPLQWGPAAPLCPERTGLKATMVGFPRDDLARWTGRFPADIWVRQLDRVAAGFARGARLMEGVESKREVDLYRAEGLHFESAADQARFLMARDRGDRMTMADVAGRELKRAREYLGIIRRDSRIGYECSNHYFAIPQDVREKILQCAKLVREYGAAAQNPGGASARMPSKPTGHLAEFLRRQVSGTTGNRQALGYPFDGCMWAGSISNVYFEEDLPYSRRIAAPRDEIWWPYEQSAYLLDGMMRLSRLVDAPQLRSEFKRNLDWCIEHAGPDGDLFAAYSKSDCQWPLVVFFRAALAYVEETGDERVKQAFIRHYAARRNGFHHPYDRDVLSVEGLLKVAEWTGDRSYVDVAEQWFKAHDYHRQFTTTDRVHSHGVTFCEMLKIPMLLYGATGWESWRRLAVKAMRDVFRQNEMPNGQVSACEYLSGRDPWEGSETCDAADMMCALSHFLDDPEVGCEAADHMERIAYNALPGAMTKDFTAHQYISLPNQAVATPFSFGGHFFYGEPDWNRFRVCHFAQCCSGNINRAMPLFAENMWRRGKSADQVDGEGCADGVISMLLGPGRVNGDGFEIVCETDYPFGDRLVYRFKMGVPKAFPFEIRVPSWVRSAVVSKNGKPMNLAARPGTLARMTDSWRDGDTLEVIFEQPVTFHSDRQWHWLRRGALTLAHPVKTRCVREKPGERFSDLSFEDPEPFNYAFDLGEMQQSNNQTIQTIRQFSPYPFETPNLVVKVPMREIREWQGLAEQRFTPPVPLYTHETGRTETLDFVPYATTLTRITAFPDTVKRTALPVVRTYVSAKCYAYDPAKPLALQQYEPERWSDEDFMDKADVIQRSPDLWSDLEAHFHAIDRKMAYLLFRFWSDREGTVTCALGASRCVQAFFEGKEVYSNGPIVEGRMVAPFWFDVKAKRGHNFLKVKVACGAGKEVVFGQDQYRREWGARLDVFSVGR